MPGEAKKKQKSNFRFLDFFIIVFFLSVTAVCLYLFRLDLLNTFSLQNVEPVGTVIIKKNIVQRRLNDRIVWDTLKTDSPVYVGDLIRVAEISSAMLDIQDNSIDLDENTLIRISLSPDGESLQISVTSGTLAVYAGEKAGNVSINIGGRQIKPEPGTVIRAIMPENGQTSVKVYESTKQFINEEPLRKISELRLLNPAVNSIIRYHENITSLNFQWTKIEEALSYTLQISNTFDFLNPHIHKKTSAVSVPVSLNDLGQGLWYWRVMLELPPMYSVNPVFSNISFFRIGQTAAETNGSITQWLDEEAPSVILPSEIPQEIIAANFNTIIPALPPIEMPHSSVSTQPRPAPAPVRPPSVALLPVPQNPRPAQRTTFGFTQLQSQRSIDFRWSAVQGANAYIFTLYQQGADGRRQIFRTTINNGTRYTLDNLSLLDRGTFIWQVEAVRMGRGNVIERHGRVTDNSFIIDFPSPSPIQIEDTGILYGN
jgi:hypothetical protein